MRAVTRRYSPYSQLLLTWFVTPHRCGAAFVSAQRAFRTCPASCQPLFQPTAALSSVPVPSETVLESLGVVAEPTLQHYTRMLRELPTECSGRRLTPPERRALLAALKLAANAPGFAPDGRLAVLTADGCAVAADKVVVDDAPWLLRRLRPGAVHVASSALEPPLRAKLRLRPLSEAVRVVLAPGSEPTIENTCDDFGAAELL